MGGIEHVCASIIDRLGTTGDRDAANSHSLLQSKAPMLSRAALLARRVSRRALSDKVVADMRLDHGAGGHDSEPARSHRQRSTAPPAP